MIVLRPFRAEDEDAAVAAHEALKADNFPFLLFYTEGESWTGYLKRLEKQRLGIELDGRRVPASFLAATWKGELVGRVSVRHQLNDWLAAYGGHIGYGVVPWQRRKGYATEILREALLITRSLGIEAALVICDEDNVGSARTIEACGGEIESITDGPDGDKLIRRYWVR